MAALTRTPAALVAGTLLSTLAITTLPAPAVAFVDPADTVFVNEIHYDNAGTDVGEAIEVAAPAGTDLTGWSLVLYNGSGGAAYTTLALDGVVADQGGGYGTLASNLASNGLQNGSPDGIALVGPGGVEQFLSYEGSFVAVGGAANGLTSTDIGVAETGVEPIGGSLHLTGTGDTYGDFSWSATTTSSFGAVNAGQTFTTDGPAVPVASCPGTLTTTAGTPSSADVSATDADSAIVTIRITSAPVAGITLTETDPPGTARLDVAATTAVGNYPVTIEFVTDDDPQQTASCTIAVAVEAPPAMVKVSEIQGDGATTPLDGQDVVVSAVVTSFFTSRDVLDGFFVQEEDVDADASIATSEGLFVFCRGNCPADLLVGDLVEVRGEADDFNGMTQINASPSAGGVITTISRGNALPTAVEAALPAGASTRAAATYESIEGMVVTFAARLVVIEYFELARFGQLVLAAGDRPYQFTHDNAPGPTGYSAHLDALDTRRIYLDDDNNDQNDAISDGPDEPYPYPAGGLAVDNRVRSGDRIDELTGVMHWSFAGFGPNAWRVRPIQGRDYSFTSTNPAPAAPAPVGGTLRVATYNVLNFFTTIDTTSGNSGPCGPSGTLDCRGADSAAELAQQQAKIVAALAAMDAHVVGLIEIENDAGASTRALVDALNATTSPGRYAAIDTGTIGGDAIKVALIYQPAIVQLVGPFAILDSSVDPRFIDTLNRPVLIQTFEQVADGERFTVAVNHLKSKGSSCASVGDPDLGDGQGNCSVTRTNAAAALADYLAADPTGSGDPDFLIVGDLNSYRREVPITTLVDHGYVDLIEQFVGDDAYSFLFDGQLGYLDHALAIGALAGQVTGVAEWAINADEVPLFDYNDTIADPGESSFERESAARPLASTDPRRSSDHNPLLVGLDLDATPNTLAVDDAVIVTRRGGGGGLAMAAHVIGESFTTCPTVALAVEGVDVVRATLNRVRRSSVCARLTNVGLVTFDLADGAFGAAVRLPNTFVLADTTVTFELTVDGDRFAADVTGTRRGAIWIAD